jgi:hypothetical protein
MLLPLPTDSSSFYIADDHEKAYEGETQEAEDTAQAISEQGGRRVVDGIDGPL